MLALPLFLQLAVYGVTATVIGFALRFLWKHLKDQRARLLKVLWRPAKVGVLVFAIWILWELFLLTAIATDDGKTWLDALEECDDRFIWGECISDAHRAYFFPFLLPVLLLKAVMAGILVAFFLKMDPIVRRVIVAEKDEKTPRQTLRKRIANSIKSTRDSVSNKRKKLLGFRPWKIFGRRKKDDQSAPSAGKKQPARNQRK